MAVPKKKTPRSKKSIKKRSYWAKTKTPALVLCPQCKRKILPHRVCPYCGTYKGRQVLDLERKKEKKKRKKESREKGHE